MRRLLITLSLVAVAVAIPTVAEGHHVKAKTYTIKTGDNFFEPTKKTIHLNGIVKWVWVGADKKPGATINEHTIAERDGKLPKLLSAKKTEGTYKFRFKKTGKYVVVCAEHPEDMILRVTVKK
jgi:plastocyanin